MYFSGQGLVYIPVISNDGSQLLYAYNPESGNKEMLGDFRDGIPKKVHQAVDNSIYFYIHHPDNLMIYIWVTNGTSGGTALEDSIPFDQGNPIAGVRAMEDDGTLRFLAHYRQGFTDKANPGKLYYVEYDKLMVDDMADQR